jgi:hypothetical protein
MAPIRNEALPPVCLCRTPCPGIVKPASLNKVMNFDRINYDSGVMFVFWGKNSQLYTVGIHPKREECCSGRHSYHLSRLQASAQRKYDAGLLLGYYTPDGSVHTFDDGDEDAMFDRLAKIREYMQGGVERDISTFREIDEPLPEYEPPTEQPSAIKLYNYPKYDFES